MFAGCGEERRLVSDAAENLAVLDGSSAGRPQLRGLIETGEQQLRTPRSAVRADVVAFRSGRGRVQCLCLETGGHWRASVSAL